MTYYQRNDIVNDSNIIIINVSSLYIETFQIINIYNKKSLDSESDNSYTIERSLQNIQILTKALVARDFNSYYSGIHQYQILLELIH